MNLTIGHGPSEVSLGGTAPLALIAGPCVIESREHTLSMAHSLAEIAGRVGLPFIFKASFDKANRTSIHSYRGPGLDSGLATLGAVRDECRCAVLTDIHEPGQAAAVAEVCDVLQIPAFLCRQTDLLVAAARTGAAVNIKKGQFVSPAEMRHAVEKVRDAGNERIFVTERGTSFGYQNLVVDFRSLQIMREFGVPVVFDVTHSLQIPGGQGSSSGGVREFAPLLARAAIAAGVDALFLEVHDQPAAARSDPATQWPLADLEPLLEQVMAIDHAMQQIPKAKTRAK